MRKIKSLSPKSLSLILILAAATVIGLGWWLFQTLLEGEKPTVTIKGLDKPIGLNKAFEVRLQDLRTGLKQVAISITQGGLSYNLASREFSQPGVIEQAIIVTVNPQALKLKEGEAEIVISSLDHSWRQNHTLIKQPVVIDTTPPKLFLLTPTNYLNPGGTGVALYKSSEPLQSSGIMINEHFSAGYPTVISGKEALVVYYPVPLWPKKESTKFTLVAEDLAGNKSSLPLPHIIREKKFPHDKMVLSAKFLNQKMPEFEAQYPELKGKTPLEIFIHINNQVRKDNFKTIQDICRHTSLTQYWEGPFLRMINSATMAPFGEKRTYFHGGKQVGESVHLGVDLASTAQAPVEAANHGVISFVGYLGIYGNTVIIDHGLGLFSLYSHLSNITANIGQRVKKGERIGNSGVSGLAGGDHLHFSIIAGGEFVNPKEWWDAKWIADNVTNKLTSGIQ